MARDTVTVEFLEQKTCAPLGVTVGMYRKGAETVMGSELASAFADQKVVKIIDGEPSDDEPEPASDPDLLADLNVRELKKLAKAKGIDLGDAKRRSDIVDVLSAADNGDDDETREES